jgi:hypothetical protein
MTCPQTQRNCCLLSNPSQETLNCHHHHLERHLLEEDPP